MVKPSQKLGSMSTQVALGHAYTGECGGEGGGGFGGGKGGGEGPSRVWEASTMLARVRRETRSIASFIVLGLLSILSAHQGGLA